MRQQSSNSKEFSLDSKLFKESTHERPEVSRNIKSSLKVWNDQLNMPQKYLFYDIHQSLLVFVFKLLHSLLRVLRKLLVLGLLGMLEILLRLMVLRVLVGLSVLGIVGLLRMALRKWGEVLLRIVLWLLKVVGMLKLLIGRMLGSILMFELLVGVKRIVQVRLQQLFFIFDHLQGLLPLFHRKASLSHLYLFHLFEHNFFILVKNSQLIEIY